MNTREVGEYFCKTYEDMLLKFNNSKYEDIVSKEAEKYFFQRIKKENPKFNLLVYTLHKDLNSPELKDFVAGFYSERLLNNHWHHMLKLKHLDIKDLKSFQVDLSKNFFIF